MKSQQCTLRLERGVINSLRVAALSESRLITHYLKLRDLSPPTKHFRVPRRVGQSEECESLIFQKIGNSIIDAKNLDFVAARLCAKAAQSRMTRCDDRRHACVHNPDCESAFKFLIAHHGRRIEIPLGFLEKRGTSRRRRAGRTVFQRLQRAAYRRVRRVVRHFETDLRGRPRLPPMNTEKSVHGETGEFLRARTRTRPRR